MIRIFHASPFLAIIPMLFTLPPDAVAEPQSEVAEPQSEVAEPQSEVAELQSEVAEPQSEVAEPQSEVAEPQSEVAEPQSEVAPDIEFSCLHWDGVPGEKLYYREGDKFHPLELRQGSRSGVRRLGGMHDFELYGDAKQPGEGELPYVLLAKAAIPVELKHVLFFIIAEKENDMTNHKIVTMDDSHEAFPRGNFRFANFTGQELSIEFSGETSLVSIDQMVVMPCKMTNEGSSFVPCIIRAVPEPPESPEPQESTESPESIDAAAESVDQDKLPKKADTEGEISTKNTHDTGAGSEASTDGVSEEVSEEVQGEILYGSRLFGQSTGRELVMIRPSPVEGRKALKLKFYAQLIGGPVPEAGE